MFILLIIPRINSNTKSIVIMRIIRQVNMLAVHLLFCLMVMEF